MFNPNEHLMDLKGKAYLQVMWRLVWFRDEHPNWGISTELTSFDPEKQHAIFKATIFNEEGNILSTATGSESARDFKDFIEKAETKAVGRALGMLGYGTQFTADEFDEGERIVDSPVQKADKIICTCCGKPLKKTLIDGKRYSPESIAKATTKSYGKVMCYSCKLKADRPAPDHIEYDPRAVQEIA